MMKMMMRTEKQRQKQKERKQMGTVDGDRPDGAAALIALEAAVARKQLQDHSA